MNGTRLAVNDDGSLAVANADGSPIAGGSTTVGNVAVATAAAPAYVEGATVPLSVDLAGTLRSTGGSGGGTSSTVDVTDRTGRLVGHVTVDNLPATQPVSGTVTANAGTGVFDVTPATPAANDYLPVRLTDGTAFYAATGGGGGGGAATIADGADVAQGTTTDTAWTTGAGTVIGLLKAAVNAIKGTLTADITDRAARLLGHVTVDNASIPVTGTFWQATQPVSGTVTANLGTVDGLALDATLTGGTQKAIPRGAAKGTTAAGDVTSAAVDANTQAMHVQLAGTQPTIPVSGTFWQAAQPVSGTIGVSNAFALDATLGTTNTELGGLTETAPSTDTGSSGLNGRLQRVAQRLTSLIGQIPATLGQKTMANSLAVTVASDQSGVPVTGTFWQATQPVSGAVSVSNFPTTQPVSGTFWQATQPVSGTVTANQSGSPWTIQGNQSALTTGSITTATTVVSMSVTNTNIVTVGVFGTYAGVSFVFEASMDNTNWFSMQGTRTDAFVTENGATTLTNTTRAWDVPIGFFTNFRVRATAWTSGTASIVMGAQAMPYEPSPNVGLSAVGGTALASGTGSTGQLPVQLYVANGSGVPTAVGFSPGQNVPTQLNNVATHSANTPAARASQSLVVIMSPNFEPAYMASTAGTAAIPTTLSTTTSLAYLFHGSGVTPRYEITRIEIDVEGPTTASVAGQVTTLRLNKITAENGTPGGTSQTVLGLDGADAASGGVFRTGATGAPTRTTGDVATWQIQTIATNQHQVFIWDATQNNQGKGLVCRGSTAEGWEIRAVTNATAIGAAVNVAITFYWKELA
jgi:hypothetical protein